MSSKERLHQLIDEMNDDQAAVLLLDLEEPREPLSTEDTASIKRGRARRGPENSAPQMKSLCASSLTEHRHERLHPLAHAQPFLEPLVALPVFPEEEAFPEHKHRESLSKAR